MEYLVPVHDEPTSAEPSGKIVTFEVSGVSVPFMEKDGGYYMLDKDGQPHGKPFTKDELAQQGVETPTETPADNMDETEQETQEPVEATDTLQEPAEPQETADTARDYGIGRANGYSTRDTRGGSLRGGNCKR